MRVIQNIKKFFLCDFMIQASIPQVFEKLVENKTGIKQLTT